jgi:transposase
MIYAGIDVSKDRHHCFILDSSGEVLENTFGFKNSRKGFDMFHSILTKHVKPLSDEKLRVGLEATGHYNLCLEEFLRGLGLNPIVFNPLSTNSHRKASTLRKTKTDKADAKSIAGLLVTETHNPTPQKSYHINELKSLSRNRFRLVGYQSRLKISIVRLLDMLFPELNDSVCSVHRNAYYQMLLEYPCAYAVASCHLTRLTNILNRSSNGQHGKAKAVEMKKLAIQSIGIKSEAMSMELQQTIRLVLGLKEELSLLENKIKGLVNELDTTLPSVPGISYVLSGIILSEIGDINRFSSPAKLLAFAGLEPSIYQSGNYIAGHTPMVKRGSSYLRWALISAARLVARYDSTFGNYLHKKQSEGKHYTVALSHTARKLVRVIFYMLKTGETFIPQA